jgi:hypothetical protein
MHAQEDSQGLQPENALGGYSYGRCTEACRNIVLATTYLEDIDISYMHMFIAVTWICAAELLAKQIPRLRQRGQFERAQEMEQQMITMERGMERLVETYPVFSE